MKIYKLFWDNQKERGFESMFFPTMKELQKYKTTVLNQFKKEKGISWRDLKVFVEKKEIGKLGRKELCRMLNENNYEGLYQRVGKKVVKN